MRFLNKYKIHEHFASGVKKLPTRVLKFKRPKWTKIRNKFLKNIGLKYLKRDEKFNIDIVSKKWKRWQKSKISKQEQLIFNIKKARKSGNIQEWMRLKRIRYLQSKRIRRINLLKIRLRKRFYLSKVFSKKLQTRKYIASLYDGNIIKRRQMKEKITSRRVLMSSILVKPMFRIDNILWYLDLFPSPWAARHAVNSGYVSINNKKIKLNYIIKSGDLITLQLPVKAEEFNAYKTIKKKFWRINNLLPFMECDYFTNTFIVLKGWDDLSENDLTLMFPGRRNISCKIFK